MLPPLVPCRAVVTIHDCIHLMFPQYLPNRLAYALRAGEPLGGGAAGRADPHGVGDVEGRHPPVLRRAGRSHHRHLQRHRRSLRDAARPRRPSSGCASATSSTARSRCTSGNIKPHKNLERLIDAFDLVRRGGFERLKLLIIGDQISKYPRLRRAVDKHKLHKHVRFLGFVPDDTLAALYRLATVFVFPSLYEGFGLPPLEAMASGTPVVTSNRSSLPEVVGDAAVLVDPYSAASIAEGIQRVLGDATLRRPLSARGLARAREFSWEASVRRIHEVYMDVASGSGSSAP